jgi:hypothetical protein
MNRIIFLLATVLICSCQTTPPKAPVHIVATKKEYKELVENQLGPIWYRLVEANDYVSVGTVETSFEIPAAGGGIRNLKIISNTGNRMDETIVRSAIAALRAPSVPPQVLHGAHYFVLEESFTIFPKLTGNSAPLGSMSSN